MKKLVSLIMCVALFSAMLAGCGGYSGGKVKDGVYTNDVLRFKVTPDDDMTVMEDPMESTDAAVAFSYCYMQGGKDSFKAEYALNNLQGGMAIVSEENVGGYSTDDFGENIEAQLKEKVFWTYKTEVNEDRCYKKWCKERSGRAVRQCNIGTVTQKIFRHENTT